MYISFPHGGSSVLLLKKKFLNSTWIHLNIKQFFFSTPTVVYNQSKINLFQCLVNRIFPTRLFTLNIPMIFMLSTYKWKKKESDYNLSSSPANFRWNIRKKIMNDGHWNAILVVEYDMVVSQHKRYFVKI